MATVEGHPDFGVLERRLIELVRTVKGAGRAGAFAPVAIVAPTGRLLAHLRQVLAAAFPSLLNVRFLHHEALLREAAAAAGAELPRPLADHARQALVAHLAAEEGGALAEYVLLRPGSAAALQRTIDDLREAGVEGSCPPAGLSRSGAEMIRLYARYAAALDRMARAGLGDRAARARSALPHVAPFARRFALVAHYGAYDLIGVNLDLLRAVDASGVPLTFLVPFHPTSPAYAHARRFWPGAFDAAPVLLADDPAAPRRLGGRLRALYDEEAPAPPPEEGAVRLFHTQGAAAELREAALRILALHRDRGIPLRRIAIIARSLEPYAPHLHDLLPRFGLPFVTSATRGALRDGVVQAALQLTSAVLGDYERQPLFDLLRGGQLAPGGREVWRAAQAWDRLSRDYRVTRGFSGWTRDLPERAGSLEARMRADDDEARRRRDAFAALRRRQAKGLASIVRRMQRSALPVGSSRGWREWSRAVLALCRDLLPAFRHREDGGPAGGAAVVTAVLAEMEDLDPAGVPFSARAALAHFQQAFSGRSVPIGAVAADGASTAADNGGVRVLDAMQARGSGFEAVFLIGFNADLFPRRRRPDPLLDDGDRAVLRARTGRPLPIESLAREEEHLLLAHMLGAAGSDLTVSWQRADDAGAARVPSLALREVARVTLGAADLDRVAERAERIPAHPLESGRRAGSRWGLLPAPEARIGAALQLADPGRLRRALPSLPAAAPADRPVIEAGLAMLGTVEDFAARDLRFDGCAGDAAPPPLAWSPSRLERLGVCPQQYFFRHALHVEELAEPAAGYEVPLVDLGRHVHDVLQLVYRRLLDEGLGGGADATARAATILEQVWERESAGLAGLVGVRYPLLWEAMSRQWLDALRAFLRADLADLQADGGEILGLEKEVSVRLTLDPSGRAMDLRGRFDRIRRAASGEIVVSDYKTSGNPRAHVDLAAALRGRRLQMPLYMLMAEARHPAEGGAAPPVRAEILGAGPVFLREAATWDEEAGRAVLEQERFDRCRAGFGETLAVLVDLAAAGFFPLNDQDAQVCGHCPYLRACRRGQAPAAARLEAAGAGRDYFLLRNKSTRAPLLQEVRDAAEGEDGR